jgi:penicillin-binding protein 1A
MQDVITRGTGRGAYIGRPAAGKTGTTDDYADAWFVGFTPDLVAAVWVGYPQGRISMTNVHGITVYGGTLPASIWRTFMLRALAKTPPTEFDLAPEDVVTVKIDPRSGLLASKICKAEKQRMLRQFVPTITCPPTPPKEPKKKGEGGEQPGDKGKEEEPGPEPSPEPPGG